MGVSRFVADYVTHTFPHPTTMKDIELADLHDRDDDGDTPLLGAQPTEHVSGWRSIVLEVCPCSRRIPGVTSIAERTDPAAHHRQPFIHRRTLGPRVGEYTTHRASTRTHTRQRWKAMRTIGELIVIVPVIMNLKGNLEMNLSARLGTAANMGELDDPSRRRKIILGNLALLQVQATVVACVAACVAVLLSLFVPDPPPPSEGLAVRAAHPLPINTGLPKSGFVE